MDLEHTAIALRQREPWEAVDLGAIMLQAWWIKAYGTTLCVVIPVAVLTHLLLPDTLWLAVLLTWWLKPFYDRVILHIFAHAIFGAVSGVCDTLRGLRGIIRGTGLTAALLWRRFDFARAFHLPVNQLERQFGRDARTRRLVLGRRAAGHATGLLAVCVAFELVAMISLSSVVDLVTPATLNPEFGLSGLFGHLTGDDSSRSTKYLIHACYALALCAIEPLYVAASFALYLNRRSALEAWDLELAFRRMAQRSAANRGGAMTMIAMTLIGILTCGAPAQESAAKDLEPKQVIQEVLQAAEFQEYRKSKSWSARHPEQSSPSSWNFEAMANFFQFLADVFSGATRIIAYALLAVGTVFLLRYLANNLRAWPPQGSRKSESEAPQVLFGLDVRPESLPDNIVEIALAAARTSPRACLNLLYRGALATLMHRDRIALADGHTEEDCARLVNRHSDAGRAGYFRRLVDAWSQAAYAQRIPEQDAILQLCTEWAAHFGTKAQHT